MAVCLVKYTMSCQHAYMFPNSEPRREEFPFMVFLLRKRGITFLECNEFTPQDHCVIIIAHYIIMSTCSIHCGAYYILMSIVTPLQSKTQESPCAHGSFKWMCYVFWDLRACIYVQHIAVILLLKTGYYFS